MPEEIAIALLTLLLILVGMQGKSEDMMRFMVSVQQAEKPAGWGWLVILAAVGVLAVWLVVR